METANRCPRRVVGAWTVGALGLLCLLVVFAVHSPLAPQGRAVAGAAAVGLSAVGSAYLLNGQLLGRRLPAGTAWGAAAALTVWAAALGRLVLWEDPANQLPLAFLPLLPAVWVIAACQSRGRPPGR